MFVIHEVTVEASFEVSAARLVNLVNRGVLNGASEAAYEQGIAAVVRVGPFGGLSGLSKLVRVRFLEPARHGATVTVPLRWEATGAAGELFPVLDADLVLARLGTDQTRLALAGSYRPPFGRAGAALDRAIMRRLATATIRALADDVADAITHPALQRQSASDMGPRWRPATEHGAL